MRSGIAGGPAESGFELQRRFRASPERVFEAWTRPAALREWWCPSGWIAREVDIDLRIGGLWRIAMMRASNREDVSVSGRFLEVKPPERLVFTWRWQGAFPEMPETIIALDLRGSDDETLLTLRHERFVDAGLRHQHRSGWIAACDRLDRLVALAQGPRSRATARREN